MTDSAIKFLPVMLGGSFGSVCRYGTSLIAAQMFGSRFSYMTLIVNLSGCFLIGIGVAPAERAAWFVISARLFYNRIFVFRRIS